MNEFRQHIPAFVRDGREDPPPKIPFQTTADLLALEVVQRYLQDCSGHSPHLRGEFSYFALSGNHLMLISDEGYHWWVVGFIADPSSVDLPPWDGRKYLARLQDGREVTLTDTSDPHIVISCGHRLELSDGTVATDVKREQEELRQQRAREREARGICPKHEEDVPFIRTESPTKQKGWIEVIDWCPECHQQITSWRRR